jgi:hypothetical protein
MKTSDLKKRATVSCTVAFRSRPAIFPAETETGLGSAELSLERIEGMWVLCRLRGHNCKKQIIDCLPGKLNDAIPLAELHARSHRHGASLTVISFLGSRRQTTVRYYPSFHAR